MVGRLSVDVPSSIQDDKDTVRDLDESVALWRSFLVRLVDVPVEPVDTELQLRSKASSPERKISANSTIFKFLNKSIKYLRIDRKRNRYFWNLRVWIPWLMKRAWRSDVVVDEENSFWYLVMLNPLFIYPSDEFVLHCTIFREISRSVI